MQNRLCWYAAIGVTLGGLQFACSGPEKPAPTAQQPAARKPDPVKITQFYATVPKVAPGERSLLCYGVENASAVWLSPPRESVSVAQSRCLEVRPKKTTTYTLTAEAAGLQPVTQEVTITVGGARPKILDVTVSAMAVKPGDLLSICYKVQNTASVRIDPINYARSGAAAGCATTQPKQTTTYTITALGTGGEKDQERVTIKVQ